MWCMAVEPSASCFNGRLLCLVFFGFLLVAVLSPSSSLLCPPFFSLGWKLAWAYRFMRYSSLASSCWCAVLWHRFPWQWWTSTTSTRMHKHNSLVYIYKENVFNVFLMNFSAAELTRTLHFMLWIFFSKMNSLNFSVLWKIPGSALNPSWQLTGF